MSEITHETHPQQKRIAHILSKCKSELSEVNYVLIEKYDRAMVNETLGYATRIVNLDIILSLSRMLRKDWPTAIKDDIDKLVYEIMTKHSRNGQESHSSWDHKKMLKIFFRWVKLGSRSYKDVGNPPETDKIKLKLVKNKIIREQLLTDEEVVLLLRHTKNPRDKAMISVASEAGCRPGELLSLRIKHVKFDQIGAIISVDGKTGARNIRIVKSVPHLVQWLELHNWKDNPNAPLWPVINAGRRCGQLLEGSTWRAQLRQTLKRTGIKKRLFPNLFRHTAATNAANYMTESQLRKRQGWTPESKMPSVYVHLVNADVDEAYLKHLGIKTEKNTEDQQVSKMCYICKVLNSYDSDICHQCGKPLDLEVATKLDERNQSELGEMIKQAVAQEMQRENHYLRNKIKELELKNS
jgi:integrase